MSGARQAMRGATQAAAFLTPFGGPAVPGPESLVWFPAVGAGIGLVLGGVWWAADRAFPAAVAAAIVVGADLAITGMLHFDGVVDAADGLLPHLTRERRLAVMAVPDVGAFGVAVGGLALLARWAALATVRPAVWLLVALWCLSRTAMAVTVRTQPYARQEGGLATAFLASRNSPRNLLVFVVATVAAVAVAAAWKVPAGPVAACAAVVGAGLVVALARRQLGGFTGDVLGAAGVVCETVGLVVASAKW
jgi:adenosylcobinamide-GDP ribazoletransferase